VVGGITKELKVTQKKVWPSFPIQVGMFTLLDFGHTKVEEATLEDIKLVDIEFKKHDPHKVVENHLAHFNMKRYIHEDSPYDDIFKGVRAYEEVQSRVQKLLPDQQSGFLSFQKHRRTSLPKILQGESKISFPSQEIASTEPQQGSTTADQVEEVTKNPEELFKKINTSMLNKKEQEMLASFEAFMKQGHTFPFSPSATTYVVPIITSPEKSTALTSTILSLTPITTSFETPSSEAICIDELTPILPEEMPPSSLFFNKKRRAIVKRESQQKEGVVTKKNRLVYDGQGQNDPEFSKGVADSLGALPLPINGQWIILLSSCNKNLFSLSTCKMRCNAQK
jgi:hypothetical protein